MLRVAHISDLHIRDSAMNNDELSLLQELAAFLASKFKIEVEAGGHDEAKLVALQNRLVGLKPRHIVVTGDLTNFGDKASFEKAVAYLDRLKAACGAESIICVPGNHDCLVERLAQAKQEGGFWSKSLLRVLSLFQREVDVMNEGAKRQFSATKWREQKLATLLQNYRDIVASRFGACDPGDPVVLKAGWGEVALFLFNSVNEPGLMANKGRIGIEAHNKLNALAQDPARWARFEKAIRIGLLHHHPISAPQAIDADVNRAYDWMEDGPLFLAALNGRKFHFILHGHQHAPFTCSVSYGIDTDLPTYVVAAGSATQGTSKSPHNSFNVIDLISPFEAAVSRFDMGPTGFADKPAEVRLFPLRPLTEVRYTPLGTQDTVADWVVRELVQSSGQQYLDLGEAYRYDELEFDVAVDEHHLYKGRYRRRGELLNSNGTQGPVFVITGSPAMKVADMAIKASDNLHNGAPLNYEVISDEPNRKIIRVEPRKAVAIGQTVDVTLEFCWQASATEPNDFDGINLMGFHHEIGKVKYRITMPWNPKQVRLQAIALDTEDLTPTTEKGPSKLADDRWQYEFELEKPNPRVILIRVPK